MTTRIATKKRETKETQVLVDIDLDGRGSAEVSTGLPFFDHMLDQLARHAGFDRDGRAGRVVGTRRRHRLGRGGEGGR